MAQDSVGLGWKLCFIESSTHQLEPPVARRLIDLERKMPHPQPWMAALLNISRWPTKAPDQEGPHPVFSALQVVFRVHGPNDVIPRNLPVKRGHEPGESVFANR